MRVNHPYGSKERLLEMFRKVGGVTINEEVLADNQRQQVIEDFMMFACNHLGLNPNDVSVEISQDPEEAKGMRSFGKQTPSTGVIRVVFANRNLADALRTLAHELVHRKQQLDGRLYAGAGEDGSDIENEANAQAAVIMRKYGAANPIIFE
jgi:hypothetical protein